MVKQSKTAKRNSKEPLSNPDHKISSRKNSEGDVFDFLDQIMETDSHVVPMAGTSKALITNTNLDSS